MRVMWICSTLDPGIEATHVASVFCHPTTMAKALATHGINGGTTAEANSNAVR